MVSSRKAEPRSGSLSGRKPAINVITRSMRITTRLARRSRGPTVASPRSGDFLRSRLDRKTKEAARTKDCERLRGTLASCVFLALATSACHRDHSALYIAEFMWKVALPDRSGIGDRPAENLWAIAVSRRASRCNRYGLSSYKAAYQLKGGKANSISRIIGIG